MKYRLTGCLVVGVVFGLLFLGPRRGGRRLTATEGPLASPDVSTCWLGVSSCTAAACHGGGLKGCKGSEYTTFASCDPHRCASQVLLNQRSEQILRNLADPTPADRNPLCLACHASNSEPCPRGPRFTLADGVGCESCHGPAGKWVATHYLQQWKGFSDRERAALGFRPMKDLVVRARICAGCHIGNGDVDVNHDLIAAGHPRLNFEYGSYLAIYPKHWSEKEEKARYPDLEVRAWAVGQVSSAQAALELLAHRASADKPWPEFAEYNCYACHKNLPGADFSPRRREGQRLGALPWGNWYYAMLGQALGPPGKEDARVLQTIAAVRAEMNRPMPRQTEVARLARQAAAELNEPLGLLCRSRVWPPAAVQARFDRILADEKLAQGDWDEATQRYLGLAALYHALGDLAPQRRDPDARAYLKNLARQLAFPPGQDSPGRKD